ncbi:predicted protein [Nematostella vectensis]|uniref:SAM domain-containing protein n=1 Tax=Nematostella vectensis TaxID=45351 RepID=A7RVI0_NEMVE|nr:predicted protein [Nematostella vectensis]|eukprot:XP_001636706.1 predicted protein [Nematostella vectensis]
MQASRPNGNGSSAFTLNEVDNLIWSEEEYKISDFVDKFYLPQIVKVQEGYYGPDEDSCLGAEQILLIHSLKHTEKIMARDRRRRELHIPLNCSIKVEQRPSNMQDVIDNVYDLARHFPGYVRVTQGYYSLDNDDLSINPGDKLELQKVIHTEKGSCLVCINQDRFPVTLPFSVVAGFQPLVNGLEYYLKELVETLPRPFYFQFVDPANVGARGEVSVFNSGLGVLRCERVYTDSCIICSTKEGKDRTIVTFPKNLQVTVVAAQGALIGDKDYMRVCRFFHDGVNLSRIEHMDTHNVYASRATIREYLYDHTLTTEPSSPESPSFLSSDAKFEESLRQSGGKVLSGSHDDEDDDDDDKHDYTYISDRELTPLASSRLDKNENNLPSDNIETQGVSDDAHMKSSEESMQGSSENMRNTGDSSIKETEEQKKVGADVQPIPDDLSELTVEEVAEVLVKVHLGQFADKFEYNQIDGEMFVCLDEEVLESLGMNAFQRKKVLKLIDGWRPKTGFITKM